MLGFLKHSYIGIHAPNLTAPTFYLLTMVADPCVSTNLYTVKGCIHTTSNKSLVTMDSNFCTW